MESSGFYRSGSSVTFDKDPVFNHPRPPVDAGLRHDQTHSSLMQQQGSLLDVDLGHTPSRHSNYDMMPSFPNTGTRCSDSSKIDQLIGMVSSTQHTILEQQATGAENATHRCLR